MACVSRIVALVLLILPTSGCVTIELMEAARLQERVLKYDRIALVEGDVQIEYTAEITDELPERDESERAEAPSSDSMTTRRGAVFALSELAVRPAYPVDAFPLARIDADPDVGASLPIGFADDWAGGDSAGSRPTRAPYVARIDEQDGRHRGFRLCPTAGGPCLGYFYSEALYADPIAWWAYPISPFTFAIDLAILPIQAFSLPILIAVGD
jgi:hypothetical protein